MGLSLRAGVVATAAVALGIGLAGCGSETGTETATSSPETTIAPTATTTQAAPDKTIAEYIEDNNIVETPVRRGDPGSPAIDLPVPAGWRDASNRAPEGAYTAMDYADPPTKADSATIIVYVSKLSGNVDGAKILEYAPAEIQKLPGYEGPVVGGPTKLGGFDATQIGGAYTKNGVKRAIGQMTAVIPGQDGLYVLQLNAESPGTQDQVQALAVATGVIASQAKITL
ncbi:LpqN/LpqT family lipoprotein [Mycobacterium sp. B14F4]|uniref:LpqN/LpqT family lipoprotein n=1 Tax=Mycobacterium sp. B14F4 TaxID=3153565 RepID=UPI00325EE809